MFACLCSCPAWAGQPYGIRLDPGGVSAIYPVFDSAGWLLTQPDAGRMMQVPDPGRFTHWEDEYYAQDWARGCGQTAGLRLYAGISGQVILAGSRGPYGLSVIIYDAESRFALKYSHLSEVAVRNGEFLLAGKSYVGRVGRTGNVTGGCAQDPGAHLHLALFKNVVNPAARPITATSAGINQGPTAFAAPFGYATSVSLGRSSSDTTVYAMFYGTRVPVTAAGFESHGWDFDRSRRVFDPLAGRVYPAGQINAVPRANYLWPWRDGSLLRSSNGSLVYQFEDGQKFGLSGATFQCRRLRFGEVREVPPSERDMYGPLDDVESRGCETKARRAVSDMVAYAAGKGLGPPDLATYQDYPNWSRGWELRWMRFRLPSGGSADVYRKDSIADPTERYLGHVRPGEGQPTQWERMR